MKTLSRFILCILLLSSPAARAEGAPQTIDLAGLKVAVWLPKDSAGAPVVLFSHGFHGCATQSTFLMLALAGAGYAVFAPNHRDATCNGGESSWLERSEVKLSRPDRWDDTSYADREADMKSLLNLLPADPRYRSLDWRRVGLAGHSLGGYTVLALAGAWPSWKDARAKAVLALSPYAQPFLAHETLGGINVPVMYQGGTRDFGITPAIKKNSGAYSLTPAPRYFVEFKEAGHFAWTDLRERYHESIAAYSIAFFDTYLKGKPFPQALTRKGEQVSELRIQEGGGSMSEAPPSQKQKQRYPFNFQGTGGGISQ